MCVCVCLTGKVSIRKEDLCKYSGKEHWFSLHPVDPNSEVQVVTHPARDVMMSEMTEFWRLIGVRCR